MCLGVCEQWAVLEDSVHTTAVEQFKAGSPSGQGDWAVMKIPQERSEGNSAMLFVMGKRRRQGQEGKGAMSEEGKKSEETAQYVYCVCFYVFFCVPLLRWSNGPSQHK